MKNKSGVAVTIIIVIPLVVLFFVMLCLSCAIMGQLQDIAVAPYSGQATRKAIAPYITMQVNQGPKEISLSSGATGIITLQFKSTAPTTYHPTAIYLSILRGGPGVDCYLLSPQFLWVKRPANDFWEWHLDKEAASSELLPSGSVKVRIQCQFSSPGTYDIQSGIYLDETWPSPFTETFQWQVKP